MRMGLDVRTGDVSPKELDKLHASLVAFTNGLFGLPINLPGFGRAPSPPWQLPPVFIFVFRCVMHPVLCIHSRALTALHCTHTDSRALTDN